MTDIPARREVVDLDALAGTIADQLQDPTYALEHPDVPPEIVTGYAAAQLPPGSYVVTCAEDGTPMPGAPVLMIGDDGELDDPPYRVLYRAPEPTPPIAVGDTVTTAAELDRLPVGSIVEDADGHTGKRWPGVDGWADSGQWLKFPVIVRYLPEVTS